ncbi:MAG: cell division FtsA domain-containing protein [Thermincola sp.]|nr:cell division FtsA domain-containing protein [Thermincola sp.]MDT3702753.1 cell division FtsA domain-containing protein [Thermincola sp.]
MQDKYIFALDTGTRSVVGVVMQETIKGLEIIAAEQLEHPSRAMIDGQIHDIEKVAKAIKLVKEKLEAKIGQKLTRVAVAAAGRALKTVRLRSESDSAEFKEIQQDDILRLELQAVQEAQIRLVEGDSREVNWEESAEDLYNYHCVGYSVVFYELDGFKIGNLQGQKGKQMAVEVIATFLPRVVVDSLFAALHRADLEMTSLTLEPIAASAVVVPPSMRQLNIALVDVGAGTSDIAITDVGSIVGFGMVPMAGDEITERISQHYLLDFNQAESIKRSVRINEEITFCDVLGMEHRISKSELLDAISETVDTLAKQISEKILELNGRTPQAVMCIGGGSLTPMLQDKLAENMGLAKQRVAVRGREAISEVYGAQEMVGPEAVTPIGIAVTAYEHKGLGFARVTVNNLQVRLFEINKSTVADALLGAGINLRRTRPRLGLAQTVAVNGELKIIKGGRGQAAVIKLNGTETTIDTPVKHDDIIEFVPAEDGADAQGFICDVVPQMMPFVVYVNRKPLTVNHVITMNGERADYNDEIIDNATITYHRPQNVVEILDLAGIAEPQIPIIYVNERIVDMMTEIADGDEIIVENMVNAEQNGLDPHDLAGQEAAVTEFFKMAEVEPEQNENTGSQANVSMPVVGNFTVVHVNQERVEIPRENIILTDILTRISFPLVPPRAGTRLLIQVNGVPAEFTTPLKWGDNVLLEWV